METLFIGKNLLFLYEVESTNTYAMNLLRNVNTIEGTVVYTDNQTKGKGQRGALWTSKIAQNITASVILKPQFLSISNTFYLSKISALAVYDVLADILPNSQYDIKIKWPNDILVNQHKISGILIENNFTSTNIQHSVIGIGLNVNQDNFNDFERTAISLKLLTNSLHSRDEILEKLCINIEKWYLKLKESKLELIDTCYHDYLFEINKITVFVDVNHHKFNGRIKSVTKAGKLLLELENDLLKEFDIKEVKFLS
ncbi:MAG: biotin--[acetyl-CoA-carboxylase] ligase [Bacteroidetes bacterium]|nr:biotin--[acetyl-CoA-carboxylase] ligase [Bacteroidota bacterium]